MFSMVAPYADGRNVGGGALKGTTMSRDGPEQSYSTDSLLLSCRIKDGEGLGSETEGLGGGKPLETASSILACLLYLRKKEVLICNLTSIHVCWVQNMIGN